MPSENDDSDLQRKVTGMIDEITRREKQNSLLYDASSMIDEAIRLNSFSMEILSLTEKFMATEEDFAPDEAAARRICAVIHIITDTCKTLRERAQELLSSTRALHASVRGVNLTDSNAPEGSA